MAAHLYCGAANHCGQAQLLPRPKMGSASRNPEVGEAMLSTSVRRLRVDTSMALASYINRVRIVENDEKPMGL